jgi:hypothetical protein
LTADKKCSEKVEAPPAPSKEVDFSFKSAVFKETTEKVTVKFSSSMQIREFKEQFELSISPGPDDNPDAFSFEVTDVKLKGSGKKLIF